MKNKRIYAFIIDMIIVCLLTTCLANIERFNPFLEKYDVAIEEYNKAYNESFDKFKKDKNSKKLYKNVSKSMYNLEKYSVIESSMYIVIFVLYFGVFQYFTGGETVGKKIFKLKVVNSDDSDVGIIKMLFRTLINGCSVYYGFNLVLLIRIICVCLLSQSVYTNLMIYFLGISFVFDIMFILYYFFNKQGRGLNDIIFKTKVIERLN